MCLYSGDFAGLAQLLRIRLDASGALLPGAHEKEIAAMISAGPNAVHTAESLLRAIDPPGMDVIFSRHLATIISLSRNDTASAWNYYAELVNAWNKIYENQLKLAWQPLGVVARTARVLVQRAMREREASGATGFATPADRFMELMRAMQQNILVDRSTPRGELGRTMGALVVVNEMLRYFARLRNTELATSLINQVETQLRSQSIPPLESFPCSQVVVYKFHVGRLALLDGRYAIADDNMQWAFDHCRPGANRAKRLVLISLIPVALLTRGHSPTARLLAKYGISAQYGPLIAAVRVGDVRAYDAILESSMRWLVRRGVFLAFEAARATVYKNFVRKVWTMRECDDSKGERSKVPLSLICEALAAVGIPTQLAELECIIARLVHEHRIKGYLAHAAGYLVTSQTDPFPKTVA